MKLNPFCLNQICLGMTLLMGVLMLTGQPVYSTEMPDAAVAPPGLFGESSQAERKIIYNRFEKRLSEHYRLLSSSQYKKARDKVFETVESDQCTENHCIRKIQETLQVERLFFLEITKKGSLTQLNITLVRIDDTLIEEKACVNCRLTELYQTIGNMVDLIAARDKQPIAAGDRNNENITIPETAHLNSQGDPGFESSLFSHLSREELIYHTTGLVLIAASIWQSNEEAKAFNRLAERNQTISIEASQVDSDAEYQSLVNTYNSNLEEIEQHKQKILVFDLITLLAVAWESWQIYHTMVKPDHAVSGQSSTQSDRFQLQICRGENPRAATVGMTLLWRW